MATDQQDPSACPAPPDTPPPRLPEGAGAREKALRREPTRLRRFFKLLGPGLTAGASDDDPATVGTCASVGASVGFLALWMMVVTVPLMIAVQYISARIGLVTGRGLAGVLRQRYPRWVLYPAVLGLVVANTVNAGADLGAIAAAGNLLVPGVHASWLVVPVAAAVLALQLWGSYRLIERTFKWLAMSLVAYVAAGVLARPDWRQVLWHTFVPSVRWDPAFLGALVAILGTTFAPYLYFWQSCQEVEEKIEVGRKKVWQRRGTSDGELRYAAWDVNLGMIASNVVTYFVILASAKALYRPGGQEVSSAAELAEALRPLAGDLAGVLLAVGLIGAGLLAVPVLTTSAAYAVAEAFGWQFGLGKEPGRAPRFYGIIVAATAVGVAINYTGINPIHALFLTSTVYGFLAPPLLVLLMLVSNNTSIMGERVNGRWLNLLGWAATAATFAAAGGLVAVWCVGG
jgi:NRAMP (natural resistance-associated macrophage protein)-like metal ion transporter